VYAYRYYRLPTHLPAGTGYGDSYNISHRGLYRLQVPPSSSGDVSWTARAPHLYRSPTYGSTFDLRWVTSAPAALLVYLPFVWRTTSVCAAVRWTRSVPRTHDISSAITHARSDWTASFSSCRYVLHRTILRTPVCHTWCVYYSPHLPLYRSCAAYISPGNHHATPAHTFHSNFTHYPVYLILHCRLFSTACTVFIPRLWVTSSGSWVHHLALVTSTRCVLFHFWTACRRISTTIYTVTSPFLVNWRIPCTAPATPSCTAIACRLRLCRLCAIPTCLFIHGARAISAGLRTVTSLMIRQRCARLWWLTWTTYFHQHKTHEHWFGGHTFTTTVPPAHRSFLTCTTYASGISGLF